jgi:hypothetical protein
MHHNVLRSVRRTRAIDAQPLRRPRADDHDWVMMTLNYTGRSVLMPNDVFGPASQRYAVPAASAVITPAERTDPAINFDLDG